MLIFALLFEAESIKRSDLKASKFPAQSGLEEQA